MFLMLSACSPEARDVLAKPEPAETSLEPAHEEMSAQPNNSELLAADLVGIEWSKAENRDVCAPIAFSSDAGEPATARRAEFAGGWGVAFDMHGQRSAYGLAGPGIIAIDLEDSADQAARLGSQWPEFTTLADLPAPAFAGYDIEGSTEYSEDNPDGRGLNSLAYLRIGGQQCTYNVWSRLGRAHLESLLDSLRMLD